MNIVAQIYFAAVMGYGGGVIAGVLFCHGELKRLGYDFVWRTAFPPYAFYALARDWLALRKSRREFGD